MERRMNYMHMASALGAIFSYYQIKHGLNLPFFIVTWMSVSTMLIIAADIARNKP